MLPKLSLKARRHSTAGGYRDTSGGAEPTTETVYDCFRADFETTETDENGERIDPLEDSITGLQEEKETLIANKLADLANSDPNDGSSRQWAHVRTVDTHPRTVVTDQGDASSGGEDVAIPLTVVGPRVYSVPVDDGSATLEDDGSIVTLATEEEVREGEWTGNLRNMGFDAEPWTREDRIAYGPDPGSGAPNGSFATKRVGQLYPGVAWSEYWLEAEGPVPEGSGPLNHVIFLKATSRPVGGSPTLEKTVAVTFTITRDEGPEGSSGSSRTVSNGAPVVTGDQSGIAGWIVPAADGAVLIRPPVQEGRENRVDLLPIEIIIPKIDPDGNPTGDFVVANELKVAKMEQSLSVGGVLTIDHDPDRFYVLLRGPQQLQNVSIELGTRDNPAADYNDDPTKITLSYDAGKGGWVSPSQMLVSDDVDDDHGDRDDLDNDRTHLVQLGGNVVVSKVTFNNVSHATEIAAPVKVKKTVKVRLANCQQGIFNLTQVEHF